MASIPSEVRQALNAISVLDQRDGIKDKFASDPKRVETCSFDVADLYIDFSKTHLSDGLLGIYDEFCQAIDFDRQRADLLSGEKINTTEDRSVLHHLLRDPANSGFDMCDSGLLKQASESTDRFSRQFQEVQDKLLKRAVPVRDIIHVGIGGSSLGTQLLIEAVSSVDRPIKVHFLSNIDGHQMQKILHQCEVDSTLVIGVSKTFTTAETMANLNTLGDWFEKQGESNYKKSLLAVTANRENAIEYGIRKSNIIGFPEWVGGRFSVWSSVSLSALLVLGQQAFTEFLEGARAMDKHFRDMPVAQNICFIAAALDHYYRNYMQATSRAVFAYDFRLRSLVDYLQQLETESNGKDRRRNGEAVDQQTSPVVWGGIGTDAQHSVFQMMHQGTSLIPAEFILVKTHDHDFPSHHEALLANGLAQPAALLSGQSGDDLRAAGEPQEQAKYFSGNRPSTTLLIDSLTPKALGALLAFYEHRTFCGGVLCDINSFDQMGVELGKRLASEVKPRLQGRNNESNSFDPSTESLISRLLS